MNRLKNRRVPDPDQLTILWKLRNLHPVRQVLHDFRLTEETV